MTRQLSYRLTTSLLALVWLVNGLYCKVLDQVPRHGQIVGRILGDAYARPLTVAIGLAEVGLALWLLSRLFPRWAAIFQMAVVLAMNVLEFLLVPDLLLWGRWNLAFAGLFCALVYCHEFCWSPRAPTY
jgi:hypothetical protein